MFRSGLLSTRRTPYRTLSGSAEPLYMYNGILDVWGHRGFGLFGDSTTSGKTATCATTMGADVCCGTDSYGNPNTCVLYYAIPESAVSSSYSSWIGRNISDGFATQQIGGRNYGFKDLAAVKGMNSPWPSNSGYACGNCPGSQATLTSLWESSGGDADSGVVAIRYDNTLWAWGKNSDGYLGDGTTSIRISPIQIGSGNNWKSVRAGEGFVLALKYDGTLWSWGNNYYGQLGDGTTTSKSSPVQVGSGTDWVSISAGTGYSMAIKSNGTLWGWGYNSDYNLGLGANTTWYSSPVQVGSDTNWSIVYAGGPTTNVASAHGTTTFAIKNDYSMYAWGYNNQYQTGVNSYNTYVSTPTVIPGSRSWVSAYSGQSQYFGYYYNGYGITTDGKMWAWGTYPFGFLYATYVCPVQVGSNTRHSKLPIGRMNPFDLGSPTYYRGMPVITTEGYVSIYYNLFGSSRSIMYSGKGGGGATLITSNQTATYILKTGNTR